MIAVNPPQLRSLVSHSGIIRAADNIGVAHTYFEHYPHDFMAVFEGEQLVGIVSRREVSMMLGSRFGWELFGRNHVRDHLESKCTVIREDSPILEVLSAVFPVEGELFFDDIVLVDRDDRFVGLITVLTMIRVQHRYLLDNIDALQQNQRELSRKNRRNEEDLALARELQRALLPQIRAGDRNDSTQRNQPRFFYHYEPADTVGGDFYIVEQITPEWWGVFLCDVMGHGVRSALVTTMIRALFEGLRGVASDPGEVLAGINRDLARIFGQADNDIFVTAIYMLVSADGEIRYAKAGHHDPVLVDRKRRTTSALEAPDDSGSTPLGIFADAEYRTISLKVDAGSMIILFTDGLFEMEDRNHDPIGYDKLLTLINSQGGNSPADLISSLLHTISLLTGSSSFDDDICLVGIAIP